VHRRRRRLGEDEGAFIGHNLEATLADLETRMRDAAADLEFEEAARIRDEIKRLEQMELAIADDPLARNPGEDGGASGKGKGRRDAGASSKVRKNTLDEMTVRRTEVPLAERPHKPSLDVMGPGTDMEVPLPPSRPHKPGLDEMNGPEEIPAGPGGYKPRPRGRSIAGRPGSEIGKGGRR
jgi:excinuclease ABC subunit B